ncbi:hypothetical protein HPP92_020112 [Vanilla planifolia]|uniref:Uncharacterized protein n=1 Tax=Vanilla planifolia TaxID=51239 RepID=A0A835QBN1_VANPL|nr:hypothetical protein HPP92_020112 [Vanilla planifolia]
MYKGSDGWAVGGHGITETRSGAAMAGVREGGPRVGRCDVSRPPGLQTGRLPWWCGPHPVVCIPGAGAGSTPCGDLGAA